MASDGTVNSGEVITEEAVRAEMEAVAEENLVFREAFREIDATDINAGALQIPVLGDNGEEAGQVGEGSAFPRSQDEQTSKTQLDFNKYGTEVEITYESIQDGLFDVVAMHAEDKARALAEGLDAAAYSTLNSNLNADSPIGSSSGTMAYDDVVDAMTALEEDSYEPDLLFVPPNSKGDLMKSDEFTRASEFGDEVIRDGAFGQIAGIDVMVSNTGDLGDGEAILVDSNRYGYEGVREGFTSMEYEVENENKRVIQVRTRMGWVAVRSGAAIKITA